MRIAIIGTGIGGLASAWHLGREHEVTVYERLPSLGMAAHGIEIGEGDHARRVDVPLRVIYEAYYPSLVALYRDAGIETRPVDYASSFGRLGGDTYFRYRNWRIGSRSLPYVFGRELLGATSWRIVGDLARFYATASADLRRGGLERETIAAYLARKGYSRPFVDLFLLPAFAGIGTCSYESVREYPADVIVGYLTRGVLLDGVRRTDRSAAHVVERLSSRVAKTRCGVAIQGIQRTPRGVTVAADDDSRDTFDHVVLATQANRALAMLDDASLAEREALAAFRYERSRVLVHRDPALAPADRRAWAPVNFLVDEAADRPMATIWLDRVLPIQPGLPPTFQTWNPLREPADETVLAEATFDRPVVDRGSAEAVRRIEALHAEPDRRLWLCGSYSRPGVPLLESAAASAVGVARRIETEPGKSYQERAS